MAHRWVVRAYAGRMEGEDMAHLVPSEGVLRGELSLCGEKLKALEFWEKASKKKIVCKRCKSRLRR